MGDVAMTVPVLRILALKYPNLKITILSKPFFRPLFDEIPNAAFFEAEIKGKHKGILGLFKLSRALLKLNIDAVADLHHVLRSNILKFYFKFNFIKIKQINKGRAEKKRLTGIENKTIRQLKTTHQRYADVFSALGFPIVLDDYIPPSKKELPLKVHNFVSPGPEKWIGIAPFAAHKSKMYSLDKLIKVIEKLNVTKLYKLILFGGGAREISQLNTIASKYENAVCVAGKLTFKEELHLISNLDLMISMDSGNAHLAAIYGIKTVTLWGVTHPFAGFYPFQQHADNALLADREKYPLIPTSVYGNKYPEGYENAIDSIPPEAILKKIAELL